MLYLVIEHYDNGEEWEEHCEDDTTIGVYESKELAEKEIANIVEERKKDIYARNEEFKKQRCPYCYKSDDTCEKCFDSFEKTETGYTTDRYYPDESYDYSVKEIELNQRIN